MNRREGWIYASRSSLGGGVRMWIFEPENGIATIRKMHGSFNEYLVAEAVIGEVRSLCNAEWLRHERQFPADDISHVIAMEWAERALATLTTMLTAAPDSRTPAAGSADTEGCGDG